MGTIIIEALATLTALASIFGGFIGMGALVARFIDNRNYQP